MKITKSELIELKACEEGLERFITQTNNTDESVEVSSLIGGKNGYGDLLWLAGEKLPKERIARFACDCALLNVELIKPYTDKYDLIVEFLRNPTVDYVYAARAAAHFADDAAHDADADNVNYISAAVRAVIAATMAYVYATLATGAYAAARAGDCAERAAADAGAAYAGAAAYAAGSREKVEELLRELFA